MSLDPCDPRYRQPLFHNPFLMTNLGPDPAADSSGVADVVAMYAEARDRIGPQVVAMIHAHGPEEARRLAAESYRRKVEPLYKKAKRSGDMYAFHEARKQDWIDWSTAEMIILQIDFIFKVGAKAVN